jgi:lipopolysaccharide transport system permease protein
MQLNDELKNINLPAPPELGDVPYIRIQPSKGWVSIKFKELWAYRELLFFLIWRDVIVRYKQTVLGASWAILQPFISMVVFSIFFGRLAKMPSDGIPYPIFNYTAMVPWTLFATRMALASNSLVGSAGMIKKIYFPRLALPLATIVAGLVDFALAFLVLIGMMFYYGFAPTINIIWLPFFLLLALCAALGASLWLSAMNVQFRDVRYTIPFITQFWFFITPVVYPTSLIENPLYAALYSLNPMVGVIEGFRWALLGTDTAPSFTIIISAVITLVLLVSGAMYFARMEKTFADVV